jgi:hypothetical protein
MAKTNSSFNLSKPVKRMLATIGDKNQRNLVKRAFINAEHAASQPFRGPRQSKENTNGG